MDEMRVSSKLMRNVIAKLISKTIKSKTGYDVNIKLDDLYANVIDGDAHIHVDIDADFSKNDFIDLLYELGLS